MKSHYIHALARHVSAIGFGCASLGSRISGQTGVRAVKTAMDLGVNWFDVAPPYGDGRAEYLLGQAVKGVRHDVVICTKVGIRRPQISAAKRMAKPLARALIGVMPGLRGAVSLARSTGERPHLAPSEIEASVQESLRELGTDYIDVLALHEPPASEVQRDDICEALERLVSKGHVRSLSVAGDLASVTAAQQRKLFRFIQFPDTPFLGHAASLRTQTTNADKPTFVTHGVFGSGVLERLSGLNPEAMTRVQVLAKRFGLAEGDGDVAWTNLLLTFALANNPDGVVIASMFSASHASQNCTLAANTIDPSLAAALSQAVGAEA